MTRRSRATSVDLSAYLNVLLLTDNAVRSAAYMMYTMGPMPDPSIRPRVIGRKSDRIPLLLTASVHPVTQHSNRQSLQVWTVNWCHSKHVHTTFQLHVFTCMQCYRWRLQVGCLTWATLAFWMRWFRFFVQCLYSHVLSENTVWVTKQQVTYVHRVSLSWIMYFSPCALLHLFPWHVSTSVTLANFPLSFALHICVLYGN